METVLTLFTGPDKRKTPRDPKDSITLKMDEAFAAHRRLLAEVHDFKLEVAALIAKLKEVSRG
ncbi:hypothetical protein [Roseomonas chloroacetimidivorans]|uniref:hypothetical protein n=1 Tax=Roseomonas chloroacetimidivorans TaxID=1766656 RepID=UPI003C712294